MSLKRRLRSTLLIYSLRGRVMGLVWGMILAVLGLSVFMFMTMRSFFGQEAQLHEETRFMGLEANRLAQGVTKSMESMSLFVVYEDESYRQAALSTFNKHAKPSAEKLFTLRDRLQKKDDFYVYDDIREIEEQLETLTLFFEEELPRTNPTALKALLQKQLLPAEKAITDKCNGIADSYRLKNENSLRGLETDVQALSWQLTFICLALLIALYLLSYRAVRDILSQIKSLEQFTHSLRAGNPGELVITPRDELRGTAQNLIQLNHEFKNLIRLAGDISERNFEVDRQVFPEEGEVGSTLRQMTKRLRNVAQEDRIRKWENEGVTKLAHTIRQHTEDIDTLCDNFLDEIISYINAAQGGVYLYDEEEDKLELRASFAYGRKKHLQKTLETSEGLIGEAFRDGDIQLITDLPENYLEIQSGLGDAPPSCLVIVPLKTQTQTVGVFELAAMQTFIPAELSLFRRVGEVLAAAIAGVAANARTKRLLKEAHDTTEMMNAQEEELRQNTEELMATREELERQLKDALESLAFQDKIRQTASFGYLRLSPKGEVQDINPVALELLGIRKTEALGALITKYIPGLRGLNRHHQHALRTNVLEVYEAQQQDGRILPLQIMVSRVQADEEDSSIEDYTFTVLMARRHPAISNKLLSEIQGGQKQST